MDVLSYNHIVDLDSKFDDEVQPNPFIDAAGEVDEVDEVDKVDDIDVIDESGDKKISKPFRRSLFPNVPPYISFQSHDSQGQSNLPFEIRRHLKWRLSSITPLLVRRTLTNSGFRLFKKASDWSGVWGKHMKSTCFKIIKEYQKVNHFPGTFQIGRKDRLWRNLSRLMARHGRREFGFVPRTYVLPQDLRCFRQVWERTAGREKWIVKPPASSRGTGIRVVHRWSQIPKKRPVVVQQYLSKPRLISGAKFDLRLYVLVTSFNPLRIYIYPEGLVRFASVKYVDDINFLSDRFMHLTNYSINKTSANYTNNDSADSCTGHKWTLNTLWSYLERENVDVPRLWSSMKDIVIKTMISGESSINSLTRANTSNKYCCYELFGVDILLDENLKPWLLEVNISPSLQASSALDIAVKGPLIQNVFNMAGYQLPSCISATDAESLSKKYRVDSVVQDLRLYKTGLSYQERHKQSLFAHLTNRNEYLNDILEDLTPDDVRQLVLFEDELSQVDRFETIFPTSESHEYFRYFDVPRYYNMLLDAWKYKNGNDRDKGIARLRQLCKVNYHLEQQATF
ncbi:tubulin polyglutamylase TTLL4 isoform X2 [Cephus cinctus]|nr:tubulin polyglutamylase TTLL4 isoform X2 [Cephus cinctus]XP_015607237.1 tubulin polyglutamylase TTLL4 isoform X2 [Cephus cinctus]XP_024942417.1 tubulin polyglutamylase TTLL4 isoform X2 [Cephus cinctus]XP_024942455.1 tubulin polyglutamylase TTLL4 isoform X2 [Cephus cinctus]XP_024942488.1 tubulin polyglutamylase TTLL4 isoform X2 [Cephus cinctus]XP_024942522.1 tubulin polyglutamylase TTLL4 isoform X2 [Cephus cinctus]